MVCECKTRIPSTLCPDLQCIDFTPKFLGAPRRMEDPENCLTCLKEFKGFARSKSVGSQSMFKATEVTLTGVNTKAASQLEIIKVFEQFYNKFLGARSALIQRCGSIMAARASAHGGVSEGAVQSLPCKLPYWTKRAHDKSAHQLEIVGSE